MSDIIRVTPKIIYQMQLEIQSLDERMEKIKQKRDKLSTSLAQMRPVSEDDE